ncbi:MAG: YggS family pyridoxal phosphate-dependent enzyme, partial [Candidatus Limnocylindrales bacterium]
RRSTDVGLIAVSKTVPPERLRLALVAGIERFGENRVQEAAPKVAALPGAHWELVGTLQSNKARRAVELFEVIHSVDSIELARRLDRIVAEIGRPPLPVYLQVNVDEDPSKAGLSLPELSPGLDELLALAGLELRGLMTVGRLGQRAEDSRPTFVRLRELSERCRVKQPRLGPGLSMGMSDDFEVAVEEGATVVRVGRAIFGERPPAEANPAS